MNVTDAVKRDLRRLPRDLQESGYAANALALARALDTPGVTPAETASCGRALQVCLDRLRELSPPPEAKDAIDRLREGVSAAAD